MLAVEQKARGVFNIADDEPAPVSQWLPYLAACAGAKRPVRVPKWVARLLAGDMVVGGGVPPARGAGTAPHGRGAPPVRGGPPRAGEPGGAVLQLAQLDQG